MEKSYLIKQIGVIHSPFMEEKDTPIQPAGAVGIKGRIEIFEEYSDGLDSIDGFERIWILYLFDRCSGEKLKVTPYLDKVERGVFSTRAPSRPNHVGLSSVRLLRREGNVLYISDVDVLNGTPLIDVKPYVPRFDIYETERNGWLEEKSPKGVKADGRFSE